MNKEQFKRRYFLMHGCFIALFIVFISGYPGVLQAQELSAFVQSLPSTSLTGTDLSLKCLGCHNYAENHHPIGIVPSQPVNYPFPLYNGKIMCTTCHIEDHLGSVNLLREGPYVDEREFCFKCHAEGKYAEIDPHIMLDGSGNIQNVNKRPVCLFCHSVKPNPATDRTGDVLFRADVAFLCWRCHPSMANPIFFKEHFLVTPSMEMRRFMGEQERRLQVTIPLVPRGRITCSTCHNPHQKDVILYGPSASGADAPFRLRLPADKICIVCHDVI
ncbi:MAG TPA: hypothetical protein VL122_07850 [Nitrospirota bacterium]|nr:hypothetical protein [Nitrospirota bacterium]